MADRNGLGVVGVILGGLTVVVVLTACAVVLQHIGGNFVLDAGPPTVAATMR